MIINKSKSGIIDYQKRNKNKIQYDDIDGIKQVNSYKYLGVKISNKIKPIFAIGEIFRKINFITFGMKRIINCTSLKFKLNMIKTYIDPQIALLAPLKRLFSKSDENLLNKKYRMVVKKILYSCKNLENNFVELIVPKAINIITEHDNRIIKKKELRFENIIYEKQSKIKINPNLIPNNLDILIRKLGTQARNGTWISSKYLDINLNGLSFIEKFSKEK